VPDKGLPVLIPPLPLPWSTRCISLELIHEHNGHIGSEQKPHSQCEETKLGAARVMRVTPSWAVVEGSTPREFVF
jgi:hypothetical protein